MNHDHAAIASRARECAERGHEAHASGELDQAFVYFAFPGRRVGEVADIDKIWDTKPKRSSMMGAPSEKTRFL